MAPLLEREPFLHRLEQALNEAMAGQGRVALVSGEAGIGKTSLVDHFTQMHQRSVRVLWGACDSLFTPNPLGPLHDIAMQLKGKLPALLRAEADRQAIFSACLAEMQAMPTIVVFEDIHWADEATLDLIKFLGRRIQRTAALLILTYREDELGAGHPLSVVFGDLPRSVTIRLSLLPLSQASVSLLASEANQEKQAQDLYAMTGGNPFFVTEVLASRDENVPATIRDAVLARASRLSRPAREVLDVASIVPGRMEAWLLNDVLSPAPTAVEECLEHGMLHADGASFAFRHELARRALEDALSISQRQGLHRQVLKVLKERDKSRIQLSRLVHHAAFAGDGEAVFCFAPQAAKQAAAVGAHFEAAAHYQTALRYAEQLDLTERAQLLENQAYECYVTSQISEAIQARTNALEIWRQVQQPRQEGNNLRWLSRLYWSAGDRDQAERHAAEAIRLLETLPSGPELAMAYSNRAQLHMLADDFAEALRWGYQALELAEKLDDPEILSHVLNNVGAAELAMGDVQPGRAKLGRSLQLAQAHELHEHVARAYSNLGSEAVRMRDYASAMHYLNDGIAYCVERDLDLSGLYQLASRANANLEQGRWTEAGEDALAVLSNPRVGSQSRIPALVALGRLRVRRGDPDSESVLDEAYDRALRTGEIQRLGPVVSARAEAAWLQGELKQIVTMVQTAYELGLKNRSAWDLGELAFWLWRAEGLVEPPPGIAEPFALQIKGDWQGAAREWERVGCPYERGLALMDGDESAQLLALEIFDGLGARPAAEIIRRRLHIIPQRQLDKDNFGGLTAREREVARLIAQGKSNREIAEAMTVNVKTIETYVTRILAKLGFDSRVQVATWAIEKGLAASVHNRDGR